MDAGAIITQSGANQATVNNTIYRYLPQITLAFDELESSLGFVNTDKRPNATQVLDGYRAFLQVFAEVYLTIYRGPYQSQLIASNLGI